MKITLTLKNPSTLQVVGMKMQFGGRQAHKTLISQKMRLSQKKKFKKNFYLNSHPI
jgi:hypothetical protein